MEKYGVFLWDHFATTTKMDRHMRWHLFSIDGMSKCGSHLLKSWAYLENRLGKRTTTNPAMLVVVILGNFEGGKMLEKSCVNPYLDLFENIIFLTNFDCF